MARSGSIWAIECRGGEGGYARELTDDERAEQQKALEEAINGFDVVITTALVPGARRRGW